MNTGSLIQELEKRLTSISERLETVIDFVDPKGKAFKSDSNRDLVLHMLRNIRREIGESKTVTERL